MVAEVPGLNHRKAPSPAHRLLLVGDIVGIPRLLRRLDPGLVQGIMAAAIRPQYLEELRNIADEMKVAFIVQPRAGSARYSEFLERVRALEPDLIVCDSYSMLLPQGVLDAAAGGAINIHGGLLPEFRGPNPVQWAIIEGRSEGGVSIHYMDAGFDSGDLIASRPVPILFTDTWVDVMDRIARETEALLAEQLPLIIEGRAARFPQNLAGARHHRRRRPEDGRIAWSHSVRETYNLIRALVAPLPGAFFDDADGVHVLDRYLTITEVAALKQDKFSGPLVAGECALRVLPSQSNDPIAFRVSNGRGETAGRAQLRAIDYELGKATVHAEIDTDVCGRQELINRILAFARAELGLAAVEVEA